MKHLKRFLSGLIAYTLIASFIATVVLVAIFIGDFFRWKYRDLTWHLAVLLALIYLMGLLVEEL